MIFFVTDLKKDHINANIGYMSLRKNIPSTHQIHFEAPKNNYNELSETLDGKSMFYNIHHFTLETDTPPSPIPFIQLHVYRN